jgi:hypothetical protein
MNFEAAWRYLKGYQVHNPLHLKTTGGTPFKAWISDDRIRYKSEKDQRRGQAKENFEIYFRRWFEEGRREKKDFKNLTEESDSARFRYFSAVFSYLEKKL